jgi:4-hydroxybenzoate polyprenyltransferase
MKNNRWWIYQKERFNLFQYVPMIAGFSFCAVSYSMHIRGAETLNWIACIISFIVTLGWFMLLRVADEHKDYEDDLKYRPYRPVQRGLVKLSELKNIGLVIFAIQVALALLWEPKQLILLAIVYFWFLLMCFEFGNPKWLKAHPTIYLVSHMVITPLIDGYGASCEWIQSGSTVLFPMFVFMLSSFCDGTTVEVGRKIRIPEDEEFGVDSYTHLWGIKRAIFTWLFCMTISFISTVVAGFQVNVGIPILIILSVLYIIAWILGISFIKKKTRKLAKGFETFSGVWMITMYFSLGLFPFIFA